jgi:GTP cyclohydrolase IA
MQGFACAKGLGIMNVDREAAARAIRDFLRALGHPTEDSSELEGTPERVTAAFVDELLAGHSVDIGALLNEATPLASGHDAGEVTVRDIAVATTCPHHLLPALGHATVTYAPGSRLFGIGAVARLVDAFARRLTLQETIGQQVVDTLVGSGGARFAICRLELLHTCLAVRGARQPSARVVTVARRGAVPTSASSSPSGAGD